MAIFGVGEATAPISLNPSTDVVASSDGSKIYVADGAGTVTEYDAATRSLLATWQVGSDLGGIDISADGSYLMVVARVPISQHPATDTTAAYETVQVLKVSTLDGSVTAITVNVATPYEIYANDISVLNNGTALLTAGFSNDPTFYINVTTGANLAGQSTYGGTDVLLSSGDHSEALMSGLNVSDAPLYIFNNSGTPIYRHEQYEDNIQGFANGVVAFSAEGNIVAQQTYSQDIYGSVHTNLYVYDALLNYRFDLFSMHPELSDGNISGLAFNRSGNDLYVLDNDTNQIADISTETWATVRSYDVGSDIGDPADGYYGKRLILTSDDRHFVVTTSSGVRIITNAATENDFNADGHTDILWRNDNGSLAVWDMHGTSLNENAYFGSVGTSWHITDTFDMNGDGRADILWRNDSGALSVWMGTSSGFQQSAYNTSVGTEWHIAGTGDINGDGLGDIVFQRSDGAAAAWTSTGSSFNQAAYYHAPVGSGWTIEGLGDFNGDGKADILWRDTSGAISIWSANGFGGFTENSYFDNSTPSSWHIAGIADFNGDGKDDILWRNDSGAISEWTSTGTGFAKNTYFDSSVGNSWSVAAIGDYNGDGNADILWHNANGAISIWESNGSGFDQNTLYDPGAATSWHVADHIYG